MFYVLNALTYAVFPKLNSGQNNLYFFSPCPYNLQFLQIAISK